MKFVGLTCESFHKKLFVRYCEVSQNDTLEMFFDFAEPQNEVYVRIKSFNFVELNKRLRFSDNTYNKGEIWKFVQDDVQDSHVRLLWL